MADTPMPQGDTGDGDPMESAEPMLNEMPPVQHHDKHVRSMDGGTKHHTDHIKETTDMAGIDPLEDHVEGYARGGGVGKCGKAPM